MVKRKELLEDLIAYQLIVENVEDGETEGENEDD